MKKQLGDTLQFYACILGTAEQGRQYRVTITIFSDRQVSGHDLCAEISEMRTDAGCRNTCFPAGRTECGVQRKCEQPGRAVVVPAPCPPGADAPPAGPGGRQREILRLCIFGLFRWRKMNITRGSNTSTKLKYAR